MNDNNWRCNTPVINMRTVVENLFKQWKAILFFALAVSVIFVGIKYIKDYKTAENNKQAEIEIEKNLSKEELVEAVLTPLSESDREDAEFILKEKEWTKEQKEYLKNSVLLNNNPMNQRTILLDYQVSTEEAGKIAAVVYGYLGALYDDSVLEKLQPIIGEKVDKKYIAELINYDDKKYMSIDAEAANIMLEFMVVIPDGVDANEVESVITAWLQEYSEILGKTIGKNQIELVRISDYYRYNNDAVNNRTNITYSIYNVQNNVKNGMGSASEKTKAAVETIEALQKSREGSDDIQNVNGIDVLTESEEKSNPVVSKKYALLGFVLGIGLYACIYVFIVLLKGSVGSPREACYYTGSRLMGEVYSKIQHDGLCGLLHSDFADKVIYRGKLDKDKQIEKTVSSLSAACKHAKIEKTSLLCMPGMSTELRTITNQITSQLKDKGIIANTINFNKEVDENLLNKISTGVIVASGDSKAADVIRLSGLCREYDIKQLGNIFVQTI